MILVDVYEQAQVADVYINVAIGEQFQQIAAVDIYSGSLALPTQPIQWEDASVVQWEDANVAQWG